MLLCEGLQKRHEDHDIHIDTAGDIEVQFAQLLTGLQALEEAIPRGRSTLGVECKADILQVRYIESGDAFAKFIPVSTSTVKNFDGHPGNTRHTTTPV